MADTEIRIGLPLPLDVVSTLSRVMCAVYPTAVIDPARGQGRELVVVIDEDARMPRVSKKALAAAKVEIEDPAMEGSLASLDEGGAMGVVLPEVVREQLAAICIAMLADAEAPNYLEIPVTTADGTRYAVAACRGIKQTPHALRMDAEEHLGEARDKLAAIGEIVGRRTRDRKDAEFAREVASILNGDSE